MPRPRFLSRPSLLLLAMVLLPACRRPPANAPAASGQAGSGIVNPILPGDFPDPSVTRVGSAYWATATSAGWAPLFPLLRSSNLTSWQLTGYVFPEGPPAWASGEFWAPEISQEPDGRTYVFYTARRRGGALCVAVASADQPAGPYHDHGPLIEQPLGAIDGYPVRDERGQLYLIWKEDGNSRQQPTPIWAQQLSADRTALTGPRTELFRNSEPWEGELVEAVSILRHAGYFYAFYAAGRCCGRGCSYATGVARARHLVGPWEKHPLNPLLASTAAWACPGHGTPVERDGQWFLLHHAYAADSWESVGRQGMLTEFRWGSDGWPSFAEPESLPATASPRPGDVADEFDAPHLDLHWQWPVFAKPSANIQSGRLLLTGHQSRAGALIGRSTYSATYTASTVLLPSSPSGQEMAAGLALVGDTANVLALEWSPDSLRVRRLKDGAVQILARTSSPPATAPLHLRAQVRNGTQVRFSWSPDGHEWLSLPATNAVFDGQFLPRWDQGVRVGLVVRGMGQARFERFTLDHTP